MHMFAPLYMYYAHEIYVNRSLCGADRRAYTNIHVHTHPLTESLFSLCTPTLWVFIFLLFLRAPDTRHPTQPRFCSEPASPLLCTKHARATSPHVRTTHARTHTRTHTHMPTDGFLIANYVNKTVLKRSSQFSFYLHLRKT